MGRSYRLIWSTESHAKAKPVGIAQIHTNHVIDVDRRHAVLVELGALKGAVGHAFVQRRNLAPGQVGHEVRGVITVRVGVVVIIDKGLWQRLAGDEQQPAVIALRLAHGDRSKVRINDAACFS